MLNLLISLLMLSSFFSCSILQKKIDSNAVHEVAGYKFSFPKTGEWYLGESTAGKYSFGQKPSDDGSSTVGFVRSGPIGVATSEITAARKSGQNIIKAKTTAEILSSFRKDIENDAKSGRVKDVRTTFTEKKYSEGGCLYYSQTGKDVTPKGLMPISNEGKMCFNNMSYSYIMMTLSSRVPNGKNLPSLEKEKTEFFESLVFTKQ